MGNMGQLILVLFTLTLCVFHLNAQINQDGEHKPVLVRQRIGLPPPGPPKARAATPQWGVIKQKLDNFDPSDNRTWDMRYISNGQHWRTGGPVFIMIGAEWTIDPGWLQTGQMYDMAQQNSAYMFYTEHRYYGKSMPTDLRPDNLMYLDTSQALSDLANFIKWVRATNPELAESRVVVFGGSYGGTMSTWMRLKYPSLVFASVASSAPLLAKADFYEYLEVVRTSLDVASPGCTNVIRNGFLHMEQLLNQGAAGLRQLKDDFNLCSDINDANKYDVGYMFQSVAETFSGIVQYARGNDLVDTCDELNSGTGDDYARLVSFIRTRRPSCVGNYKNYVDYLSSWTSYDNGRQWMWQTCRQYGFYQTSASEAQPFGHKFPVEINYKMCQDIFGTKYDEEHILQGIDHTNWYFGGLNPRNLTRVISVHGVVDPWHALGLTHDLGPDTPVYVVPGTSHCADLQSLSSQDSPQMREAKLAEQNLIHKWLQDPSLK